MKRANGYFEAFINQNAYRATPEDRAVTGVVSRVVREHLKGGQVRSAGSQRKGTAIRGSDLDLCVESSLPVTLQQRRELRGALENSLGRPVVIKSHVLRLPSHEGQPKVDVAFANAAFGARPLPDTSLFHDNRARQSTARAIKLWARASRLPHLPGWVVEALVVHLDGGSEERLPVELFLRVVEWLDEKATPEAVEAVLRPAVHPRWDPAWSPRLRGPIQAVGDQARALRRRDPQPETWRSADDVGRWLGR